MKRAIKHISRLWISAFVIALDQLTKYWVLHHLIPFVPRKIFSFFNLTLNFNRGVAFSFLSGGTHWQYVFLIVFILSVIIFLLVGLIRLKKEDRWMTLSLNLIIGGAMSNLIDRVRLGYVVDFLDFHVRHWHYATFNVADVAICSGALILILHYVIVRKAPASH